MISGRLDRRRRALFWSTLASATLHVIFLTLLFYMAARIIVPQGTKEIVSEQSRITIEKAVQPTPAPQHRAHKVRQQRSAPARTPRYEIAKTVTTPATPQPPRPPVVHSTPSSITRDEANFAKEVAQLNRQNDPHSIPTIDPAARESSSKSYRFALPSTSHGQEHGNGIITPVRSWHDGDRDCYYGKYEYTYADGSTEDGSIAWPFCYDAGEDPFKEPPHPIPFPLPLPGYTLPADTELPPLEKAVYQQWAAANASSAP